MSEWTRAQEADFQALIHRASEQSRECYRRRDEPAQAVQLPHLSAPKVQPVTALPEIRREPPSPRRENRSSSEGKTAAPQAKNKGILGINSLGGLKALTEKLDSEGIILAVLLWLLIEEKADNTIILAIAYILLV